MSDYHKNHYRQKAKQHTKAYQQKVTNLKNFKDKQNALNSKNNGKPIREFANIKKPRNPFIMFSQYRLKSNAKYQGQAKRTERMKEIAEEWAIIPHPEKRKYLQMAEEDKLRYEQEIKEIAEMKVRKMLLKQQKGA